MSKTSYSKKTVGELPLYRSISIFMVFIVQLVLNMNKDIKITFGYNIINKFILSLELLRKSYQEKDNKKKYNNILELLGIFNDMELLFKVLFELKYISLKQQSSISINLADILMQINGWKKSVENIFENNNMVE